MNSGIEEKTTDNAGMCRRTNIFLMIFLAAYVALSIGLSKFLIATNTRISLAVDMVLSEVVLLIVPVAYILIMRINVKKCMPYRLLKPSDALLSLLFGYLLIPVVQFINLISMLFSTNHLNSMQQSIMQYPFWVQLLLMAVIPPLVEEFIFRGIFYHSYRKNGILGAAVMSGLIFGMFHLNINQFCYAFLMGIVFALIVEATASMWSSIIAHFAVNSYSVIVLNLVSNFMPDTYAQATNITYDSLPKIVIVVQIAFFAALAFLFGLLAFMVFRKLAKRNGRWEHIRFNLKKGLHAQNNERFITIPAAITFIACIAYMIYVEVR